MRMALKHYPSLIIEHLERHRNFLVAAVFIVFAGLAIYQYQRSGDFLFLLLLLRDVFVALFMMIRKESQYTERGIYTFITIASLASPILYIKTTDSFISENLFLALEIMRYLGIGLVTLSTLNLGKNFGIRPAYRGNRVNWGLYKFVNHPMYTGYIIFQAAYLILDIRNILVFVLAVILFWLRASKETELLNKNENIVS